MNHHAIGADIDPAIVGIARDVEATSANISSALIAVVPDRGRETGHVDRVTFDHVLHDRTGLNDLVRQRLVGDLLKVSLIHISEPTRLGMISYAVFCLKKKKKK